VELDGVIGPSTISVPIEAISPQSDAFDDRFSRAGQGHEMKARTNPIKPTKVTTQHAGGMSQRIERSLSPKTNRESIIPSTGDLAQLTGKPLSGEGVCAALQDRSEAGNDWLQLGHHRERVENGTRPTGWGFERDHLARRLKTVTPQGDDKHL
jgi:hypothetical protein